MALIPAPCRRLYRAPPFQGWRECVRLLLRPWPLPHVQGMAQRMECLAHAFRRCVIAERLGRQIHPRHDAVNCRPVLSQECQAFRRDGVKFLAAAHFLALQVILLHQQRECWINCAGAWCIGAAEFFFDGADQAIAMARLLRDKGSSTRRRSPRPKMRCPRPPNPPGPRPNPLGLRAKPPPRSRAPQSCTHARPAPPIDFLSNIRYSFQ